MGILFNGIFIFLPLCNKIICVSIIILIKLIKIALFPIFILLAILIGYYGIYCTLADPTDEITIEEKLQQYLKYKIINVNNIKEKKKILVTINFFVQYAKLMFLKLQNIAGFVRGNFFFFCKL